MGDGFQKWKGFPKKKMGKLTTHALPNKTNEKNKKINKKYIKHINK